MSNQGKIQTRNGRGKLFDSVLDTIGDTPCIRVNNLAPDGVRIYVKAEFFNPAGSVKDRLALNIIEEGERNGSLKPGQTVVEATSGNTGIGLAMVCAQKGYPLVVTMADSFSIERRKLMRILGAKVVLTPRAEKGLGMYQKAAELAQANGWFLASQFETSANADIHEATTGREIIADFAGDRLDYFVTVEQQSLPLLTKAILDRGGFSLSYLTSEGRSISNTSDNIESFRAEKVRISYMFEQVALINHEVVNLTDKTSTDEASIITSKISTFQILLR